MQASRLGSQSGKSSLVIRYEFENSEAWHNRGYLPHYEAGDKLQMITYHLGDSLPGSADLQSAYAKGIEVEDFHASTTI